MKIITALLVALVFATLLILNTAALLHLMFAWAASVTVYYWILLGAACVVLSWYVRWRKRIRVTRTRRGPARTPRQSKVKPPPKSKQPVRRRASTTLHGRDG